MNKIDKQYYRHLSALSRVPVDEPYGKYKTKVVKKYGKFIEGETWNQLSKLGYINTSPSTNQLVTEKGLEQLRILEDMRRKELTLTISIIAIIISIISFGKSMGWI